MRTIPKGIEPNDLARWKASWVEQGTRVEDWGWETFQNPEKSNLKEALITEQGGLCCYCEQSVSLTNSHLEHIQPQERFPLLRFDYQNLCASCNGTGAEEGDSGRHCGHRKGNRTLPITPLVENCAVYFQFSLDGHILPENSQAQQTIEVLGLEEANLVRQRSQAIEALREALEFALDIDAEIATIQRECTADTPLREFSTALLYVLNHSV